MTASRGFALKVVSLGFLFFLRRESTVRTHAVRAIGREVVGLSCLTHRQETDETCG
jgi:hypothetical protein